jgi:hypothetical protein
MMPHLPFFFAVQVTLILLNHIMQLRQLKSQDSCNACQAIQTNASSVE